MMKKKIVGILIICLVLCSETCELCDAEAKWLLYAMKELEDQGYPIIYSLGESDGIVLEANLTTNSTDSNCDTRR